MLCGRDLSGIFGIRIIACSLVSSCSSTAMNDLVVDVLFRIFCLTASAIWQSVVATRNQNDVISFLIRSILWLSGVVSRQWLLFDCQV